MTLRFFGGPDIGINEWLDHHLHNTAYELTIRTVYRMALSELGTITEKQEVLHETLDKEEFEVKRALKRIENRFRELHIPEENWLNSH